MSSFVGHSPSNNNLNKQHRKLKFPEVLFVLSNKCKPDSLGGFYKLPNRIREEEGKNTKVEFIF